MIICTQPAEHSSRRDKEQRQRERRRVERAGKGERGQSYKCIAPKNRLTNTRMTTNDAERERGRKTERECALKRTLLVCGRRAARSEGVGADVTQNQRETINLN